MSLPSFRDRIRALARNPRHPSARVKIEKFNSLTERAYRELVSATSADVSDTVIESLPVAAIDSWLASFEANHPAIFAAVAVGSPSERLSAANENPPATIAPTPRDERIKMDATTFGWYQTLNASQKLDFASGAIKPPAALHRTEDRAVSAKPEPEQKVQSETEGDPAAAFIADVFKKHGLSNE